MRVTLALAVLVVTGALGCGTLTTHHVLTGLPGPPQWGEVRIVLEGAAEPAGLQEVAIVQAVGGGQYAKLESLVEGLQTEARSLGCDVVVHVHVDQGAGTASASGVAAKTAAFAPPRAAFPAPPPAAPIAAPPPPPSQGDPGPCSPPCSPGYACSIATCVPVCNPACNPGQVCQQNRTCGTAGAATPR